MLRRLFWFGLGAGVALWVAAKVRGYLRRVTPSALGSRVQQTAADLGTRATDFVGRVRVGMAEREDELRAAAGLREDPAGLRKGPGALRNDPTALRSDPAALRNDPPALPKDSPALP